MASKLRVTLVKSKFGRKANHRACLIGLGVSRMHKTVEVEDSACTRGMIAKVAYMVRVEEYNNASE